MPIEAQPKKPLGLFQLVMINVIAVDSIRTLPFSAVYGFSLVFFYLLAGLVFFFPTALVSAELGTGWPNRGGIYVWVREAFGKRWSFLVIWLNWIYNVIWYPTIMALIAGTFAYLFDPSLAANPRYMAAAVLFLFWAATGFHCFGMRAASWLSTAGALLGTIFPMLLIACLGLTWIVQGQPLQTSLSVTALLPDKIDHTNIAFLTSVFFGLLGLEMAATHAAEMRNPARDYPRSLWIASLIILATIILGSLAIAVVIPSRELSLATGVIQAFAIFASQYQLPWLVPLIAVCVILGGLSNVGAWIIGPAKGLLVAAQDGSLPPFLAKLNRYDVPHRILLVQATIVSGLCLLFLLLPAVNSSYWLLSVITAQLALLVYVGLFAAALRLRQRQPHVKRSYHVPGGTKGIWTVCLLGMTSCATVMVLGFVPPADVPFQSIALYETLLIGGVVLAFATPFCWRRLRKK
jgi:amino acid transporter